MNQDTQNTMGQSGASPVNLQETAPQQTASQPQQPTGVSSTQPQQLDPTIVNMARSIKSVETAGSADPYTAQGKSGEYGAYQYTPKTWAADSAKYLGQSVPLEGATVAQQNQVAYNKISDLKATGCGGGGCNPAQIASIWNSGNPDPTGNVGTNKYGAEYNTPQYVQSVVSAYNNFKSGITPVIQPTSSTASQPQQQSLSGQLGGEATDISSNMADIAKQLSGQKGSQNWWSDLLQSGGDVAGGIGDVVNAGLNLIPGVQGLENWAGGELGKAADTQVGQSVVSAIQNFKQAHPELSKDIGAGFNIATTIPMFKGLSTIADIASSGLGSALKEAGEKSILNDMTDMAGTTAKGAKFVNENPNVFQNIIKNGLHNDFDIGADGRLSTQGAYDSSFDKIKDLNSQVKPILDQPKFSAIGQDGDSIAQKALDGYTDRNGIKVPGAPNSGLTSSELIQNARELDPMNKLLWDKFEAGQANMTEINSLRSSLDSQVKSVFTDAPNVSNSKELGGILSGAMRDYVQTQAPETQPLFKQMSELFDTQKAFKSGILEGKKLPMGLGRKILRFGAKGAIGSLAGSIGGPIGAGVGFLGGEMFPTGTLFAKNNLGGILGKLAMNAEDNGVEGVFPKILKGIKGTGYLGAGVGAQKLSGKR